MAISQTGLIGYWRLNEIGDQYSTINGFTLLQEGAVGVGSRTHGEGAVYDGNVNNYHWAASTGIDRSSPIWIISVLKPYTVADQTAFSTLVDPTTDAGFALNLTASGEISFLAITNGGSFGGQGITVPYVANSEYIVQGWLDSSPGGGTYQARCRVNGSEPAGGSTYTLPFGNGSNTPFKIGGRFDAGNERPFNGLISEVIIFNREPTLAEREEIEYKLLNRQHAFYVPVETAQSGPWNDGDTWVGGLVPESEDPVIIKAGHWISVTDATRTVGPSEEADTGLPAIEIEDTGRLIIDAGNELIVRGDIDGSASVSGRGISMNDGCKILFDDSVLSNPEIYRLITPSQTPGADAFIRVRGTSGSRSQIGSADGTTPARITGDGLTYFGQIDAEFCDFTSLGDASNTLNESSLESADASNFSLLRLVNCTFDSCGELDVNVNGAHSQVTIQNCTFKNTVSDNSFSWESFTALIANGIRLIDGCVFDKHVELLTPTDLTITNNLFSQGYTTSNTDSGGWADSSNNIVILTSSYENLVPRGDVTNEFWYHSESSQVDPQFMLAGGDDSITSQVIDSVFFESASDNASGELIVLGSKGVGTTITIRSCIGLPNSDADASGTFISSGGNSNVTVTVENNTHFCGSRPGISVGDTYSGHTGMFSSIRNNLFYDPVGSRSYKVSDVGANDSVSDLVTSGNLDYNAGFNLIGNGYNSLEFSSGTPGSNDIDEDPNFVNTGRDIATWDSALGGVGTPTNAIVELSKRNDVDYNPAYSVSALLDYIKGGFTPRNGNLQSAGFDSSDIGAVTVVPVATPPGEPAPEEGNINFFWFIRRIKRRNG